MFEVTSITKSNFYKRSCELTHLKWHYFYTLIYRTICRRVRHYLHSRFEENEAFLQTLS